MRIQPVRILSRTIAISCVLIVLVEISIFFGIALFTRFLEISPSVVQYSGFNPWFSTGFTVGSGFFINQDGDIITNDHVVRGCRRITVAGYGLRAEQAHVIASHKDLMQDMAVIKVERHPSAILSFLDQPEPSKSSLPYSFRFPIRIIGFPATVKGVTPFDTGIDKIFLERGISDDSSERWSIGLIGSVLAGESGSPILDGNNHVIGIVSRGAETLRRLPTGSVLFTSGDGVYGHYITRWLSGKKIPFVVQNADSSSIQPFTVDHAVVRIFCFGVNARSLESTRAESDQSGSYPAAVK